MVKYILYRILFIFVTLFFIILLNFIILNTIKIGVFEEVLINLEHNLSGAKLDAKSLALLKARFGVDKSLLIRFCDILKSYAVFDLGNSYFSNFKVIDIILSKMRVSIPFGFFSTLIIYIVAIFLGYLKAIYNESRFDSLSNFLLVLLYIIPPFIIASILILIFSESSFFIIGGIVSDNFYELSFLEKIKDFIAHMTLPVLANVCGGLLFLSIFSKNIFLAEQNKLYYEFAQYKGLSSFVLLKNHLAKGFFLIICADLSSIFLGVLFGGSLFIEILFSLDGIGLLNYESILNKDYPIVLGSIYLLSFIGLFLRLINDIMIMLINKRIKMYQYNEKNL